MKKKIFSFLTSIVLLILAVPVSADAAYTPEYSPASDSVLMINTDTGAVIYEKNPDKHQDPASLTKIMTAIIVLENTEDLETMVTSTTADFDPLAGKGAASADIRPGETLSVKNLLYGLIMSSACEAANILANHVAGSEAAFAKLMNDKADELGCKDTNFVNAHGLPDEKQYSTVRDIAKITEYALNDPVFREICNTRSYEMPATDFHPNGWTIYHTNKLLSVGGQYSYSAAYGVKTGTGDTGTNLASTASKNGYNYLLVTMEAPYVDSEGRTTSKNFCYDDAIALYDWAFENFSVIPIVEKGKSAVTVTVKYGKGKDSVRLVTEKAAAYLLPKGIDLKEVKQVPNAPETVEAPVKKGDELGELQLIYQDKVIQTVKLVSAESIGRSMSAVVLAKIGRFLSSWPMRIVYVLFAVFIIFYVFLVVRYNNMKKRKRQQTKGIQKR